MEFYIFNADVYCEVCMRKIDSKLDGLRSVRKKLKPENNYGPYDNQESDTPQHCGGCHKFLEQPLTPQGIEYVKEQHSCRPTKITRLWMRYYDI